jgi:hypothetical protein
MAVRAVDPVHGERGCKFKDGWVEKRPVLMQRK